MAAAASWQLLAENRLDDGYLDTMVRTARLDIGLVRGVGQHYPKPLEGILGVASGIALGMYWGRDESNPDTLDPIKIVGGRRYRVHVRIGSGEAWAIVYCIPPIFSACLIIYLWWASRR